MIKKIIPVFFAFLVLLLCFVQDADAQRRRKKRKPNKKEFRNIKAPKIKGNRGLAKYTRIPAYKEKIDLANQPVSPERFKPLKGSFNPYKDLSIVSEDSFSIDEGDNNIVEVTEEVKIDSSWIKIAEYYSIWSSNIVDPYRVDREEITDPILILLYDTLEGRMFSLPQRKTQVNSKFGPRGYRFHSGVDLELDMFDSIYAAFDGVVRVSAYQGGGYGNVMVLRHYNGLETLYGHLSLPVAKIGQYVRAGELIGWGGSTGRSTGPHLHYEVRYLGKTFNPEEIYNFNQWKIKGPDFILTPSMMRLEKSGNTRKIYWHKVRRGDTMFSIARRYGISVNNLAKLNNMSKSAGLRSGKRIRVK